jgi:GT2 family glycosyltransferase
METRIEKPIVSIIVLTFNGKADTTRCLLSLFRFIDERTEVILVDNGSTDGTVDSIKKLGLSTRRLRVYVLEKNVGVGPGRNYGISKANGEFIMILDSDTVFHGPEPVQVIQDLFSHLPNCGVLGFQLLNEDGSIQRNFRRFPVILQPFVARFTSLTKLRSLKRILDSYLMSDVSDETLRTVMEVDWVIGANQIFSKKSFIELGGFEERMIYGVEDCELCLRFRQNGYRNYYSPVVQISHLYKRRSRRSLKLFWHHTFSFAYMFWKHKRLIRIYP